MIIFESEVDGKIVTQAMDASGHSEPQVTNSAKYSDFPDWSRVFTDTDTRVMLKAARSPDGQQVAFTAEQGGFIDIYTVNINGSNLTRLTEKTRSADPSYFAQNRDPEWSPDGKSIVFVSTRDGSPMAPISEIYLMNADGTNQKRLTTEGDRDEKWSPVWSPNGQYIAYRTGLLATRSGIVVIRTDGSLVTRINANVVSVTIEQLTWSPDGQRFAFQALTELGSKPDIFVGTLNGSTVTNVTHNAAADHNPIWSPDSQWLLFASDRDGNEELYVTNVTGTEQTQLTHKAEDEFPIAWEPAITTGTPTGQTPTK